MYLRSTGILNLTKQVWDLIYGHPWSGNVQPYPECPSHFPKCPSHFPECPSHFPEYPSHFSEWAIKAWPFLLGRGLRCQCM